MSGVRLGSDRFSTLQRPLQYRQVSSYTRVNTKSRIFCHLSGNAKIAGMATDLKLVGLKYNIAAAVFFVRFPFLVSLKHNQRSARFYTVLRKSHRKPEQHLPTPQNNSQTVTLSLSSSDHPDGVCPSFHVALPL